MLSVRFRYILLQKLVENKMLRRFFAVYDIEIMYLAFQSETPRPVMVSRSWAEFTLNIIDTPGLVEGGYVNDQALDLIKRQVFSIYMQKYFGKYLAPVVW